MRPLIPFIVFLAVVLASCRGTENKADQTDNTSRKKEDTSGIKETPAPPTEIPKKAPAQSGVSREPAPATEPGEILAKIDSHLVSSAQYTANPSGGITDGSVTVTNTLPDVSFQKVLLEVTIQSNNGNALTKNYYTVVNIEPKMVKTVRVPNTTIGAKLITQIVKVKSNELTKGEFVLSGSHYIAN